MTTELDEIKIKLSVDTKDALQNLQDVQKGIKNLSSEGQKASKTSQSVKDALKNIDAALSKTLKQVVAYLGKAYKESNDYVEAVNLFEVTMGSGAKAAKEYADSLQGLMGIDSKEWMNYQGSLNEMITGFGIATDTANNMSKQLTQVTYDLSSLWNVNVSEAFHKIQSGMSGQVKGLKTWGINLSVAQLKETALAHGIELSVSKMTEAQKATLRYITIMEKTTNVQGDLARTIVTPANALRIFENQLTVLKRTIGDIVSTAVTQFIPVFQYMVERVTVFATKLRNALGYEAPKIDYSNMKSAVSYVDDMDDSLQDSTDNAKKLKNVLMGFDEINKLTDTSSDTSTALGGGLPSDLGLDLSQYDYDFTKGIDTSGFESTISVITRIVMGALLAIGVFLLFTGHIPLGIALIVAGITVGIADAVSNNDNITDDVKGKILILTAIVGTALLAIGVILLMTGQVPLGIALVIAGVAVTAVAIGNSSKLSQDVKEWIGDIIALVGTALLAIGIILCIFEVIPLGIALVVAGASAIFAGIAMNPDPFISTVKSVLATLGSVIATATLVIGFICLMVGNIPTGLGLIAASLGVFFASYKLKGGTGGFITMLKTFINSIISVIETGINFVVDKLNNIGIHWEVPEILRKVVGTNRLDVSFHLNRVSIPKLAGGGVVPDGDIFMANEAGPELIGNIGRRSAVANTTQMKEVMKQGAYEGMVQALKEQGGKTSYVVLEIDGERLTKKVIKKHNELVKQTGSSPLLVGG